MITILAGGTGSIKMVRGFAAHDQEVTVISNVGDNYWLMECMFVQTLTQ